MKSLLKKMTSEERLIFELVNMGLRVIRMRGWFGRGFIATPSTLSQLQVIIFRKDKNGDFEVQMLEKPSLFSKCQMQTLRHRTELALLCRKEPYLPTKRKWNYSWQWLIPISEYRAEVKVLQVPLLSKEELRKKVGHQEPPRLPGPRPLHIMPKKQYWGEKKRRMQGAWK